MSLCNFCGASHPAPNEPGACVMYWQQKCDRLTAEHKTLQAVSAKKERELIARISVAAGALRMIIAESPRAPYFANVMTAVKGVAAVLEKPEGVAYKGFDPAVDQDELCARAGCGHPYYRHFDWMENYAPGCKYCPCMEFLTVDEALQT